MQVLNTGRYKCAQVSGLAQRFERGVVQNSKAETLGPRHVRKAQLVKIDPPQDKAIKFCRTLGM
ncbi:unnamed protein product [Fusarium graminearum]|uniref:Uncharacterized protein n=1 Tax=Gibberella zeae TaxID=5518 RepID=A0A8H3JL04_GIBZA|nr:unnamed protein product [Fusarium graminearum]CAF3568833.1 unnamed protein product [Fusarium graminearum]CAG1964784.1 unnamed protein product [Fusarium graminearum]CAG1967730.1 unnamed protein product [Fusarium graminearum]CAG1973805.1 unnamed protein product [Fusarium graminearum]